MQIDDFTGKICHDGCKGSKEQCEDCKIPSQVLKGEAMSFERSGFMNPEKKEEVFDLALTMLPCRGLDGVKLLGIIKNTSPDTGDKGKELLAMAIHLSSPEARYPFKPVNMASLSGSLFDAEFFGHTKGGAFTGAEKDRAGHLQFTDKGTLFLKEDILKVYESTGRNKTRTARLLGIGINTLRRKLRSYGRK